MTRPRMEHCRTCGMHVGIRPDGTASTVCECGTPNLEGPDPGCEDTLIQEG